MICAGPEARRPCPAFGLAALGFSFWSTTAFCVSPGGGEPLGFNESDLSQGAVALPVPMRAGAMALAGVAVALVGIAALTRRRARIEGRPDRVL